MERLYVLLYYFPNKEVLDFMVNDLFEELKELISEGMLYNEENKKDSIRIQNRNKIKNIIVKFIDNNHVILKKLKDFMVKILLGLSITLLILLLLQFC